MKVLLDTCVSKMAVAALDGHDVERTGDWESDPGDEAILNHAREHAQVLVTLDKDFGELAIVRGLAHSGIIRLVGIRSGDQGPIAAALLEKYGEELAAGAIVTASEQRTRIRPSGEAHGDA